MKLTELFLAELEREAKPTRRVLENVPDHHEKWKPHPKSMELGYLSALVAAMPAWVVMTVNFDGMDISGPESAPFRPVVVGTSRELVEALDASVAKARQALQETTDEQLMKNWKFIVKGRVISDLPRHIVLRDTVFNHLSHHRGQLSVYLRLNDAKVPSIYGPTADEPAF
jgi:uncharacterized damage-inducible protein DinB